MARHRRSTTKRRTVVRVRRRRPARRNPHEQHGEHVIHPFANQAAWGVYRLVAGGRHGTRLVFVAKRATRAAALALAKRLEIEGGRRRPMRRNPALAVVGANPPVGEVVEIRYYRRGGAHPGWYKHRFSPRATMTALSDGSLRIR